jgi:hypothetical protein
MDQPAEFPVADGGLSDNEVSAEDERKLGTFAGVYVPVMLGIFGVVCLFIQFVVSIRPSPDERGAVDSLSPSGIRRWASWPGSSARHACPRIHSGLCNRFVNFRYCNEWSRPRRRRVFHDFTQFRARVWGQRRSHFLYGQHIRCCYVHGKSSQRKSLFARLGSPFLI